MHLTDILLLFRKKSDTGWWQGELQSGVGVITDYFSFWVNYIKFRHFLQ